MEVRFKSEAVVRQNFSEALRMEEVVLLPIYTWEEHQRFESTTCRQERMPPVWWLEEKITTLQATATEKANWQKLKCIDSNKIPYPGGNSRCHKHKGHIWFKCNPLNKAKGNKGEEGKKTTTMTTTSISAVSTPE